MNSALIVVCALVGSVIIGIVIGSAINSWRDRHVHKWEKWKVCEWEVKSLKTGASIAATRQARNCQTCGFLQVRRVDV